jgi:hypothetical protein
VPQAGGGAAATAVAVGGGGQDVLAFAPGHGLFLGSSGSWRNLGCPGLALTALAGSYAPGGLRSPSAPLAYAALAGGQVAALAPAPSAPSAQGASSASSSS